MPCNAANEAHWQAIADRYALEPGPINLENGYFGRMSRAVQAQYLEHVGFINRSNAVHVRQRFEQGENVEIRRQLAELIDADLLIILTAVEKVAIHFGKPEQQWLDRLSIDDAKRYLAEGQFAVGSMRPKVEAALAFAESRPGRKTLITMLTKAKEGIEGRTGTIVG